MSELDICINKRGFSTRKAAKRYLHNVVMKRFNHKPRIYKCPICAGFHYTTQERADEHGTLWYRRKIYE